MKKKNPKKDFRRLQLTYKAFTPNRNKNILLNYVIYRQTDNKILIL